MNSELMDQYDEDERKLKTCYIILVCSHVACIVAVAVVLGAAVQNQNSMNLQVQELH